MLYSTLTSKGQTTIPSELRSLLNVKPGDTLQYQPKRDGTIILSAASHTVADLYGLLPKPSKAKTIEEMNNGIEHAINSEFTPLDTHASD